MEAPVSSTPPDHLSSPAGATPNAPTASANAGQRWSTSPPEPATIPPSGTRKNRRHPHLLWRSGLSLTTFSVCQDVGQF